MKILMRCWWLSFESELEEFMQDVPGMCEAMTTYVEARAKLLEKKEGSRLLADQRRRQI